MARVINIPIILKLMFIGTDDPILSVRIYDEHPSKTVQNAIKTRGTSLFIIPTH